MTRKVVLSRKGFDLSAGGKPSFIYGNRLITLPIPGDGTSGISYDRLRFDDQYSLQHVMREVGIPAYSDCHLDPDLHSATYSNRDDHWRPSFGQAEKQETRLKNGGVGPGDVFLFYGWFKEIQKGNNGRFQYVRNARDLHVIYGYMIVDSVLDLGDPKIEVPSYIQYHPHVMNRINYGKQNRIYSGIEAGLFQYHKDLVLTRQGESRSRWELPSFFAKEEFAAKVNRAKLPNGNVALDFIGRNSQELLITSSEQVLEWALNIIRRIPKG
ncbi:hypothetical protein ACFPOG_30665 [Paenibacillus aestuarii]|uniref:Nucleotide modification associated domain-containing protein n=1 Tax=Paenibacillus aestuarii TaxID=516965 RepID=A0ABW0KIH8_9BACL